MKISSKFKIALLHPTSVKSAVTTAETFNSIGLCAP